MQMRSRNIVKNLGKNIKNDKNLTGKTDVRLNLTA